MELKDVVALLGGFSAILAAITWLVRSIIKQILARNIEDYKSHLERLTEEFKSDLARNAKEHEIRFSSLHEKRRAAIRELYTMFADAVSAHEIIGTTALLDRSELPSAVDDAFAAFKDLQHEFLRNRIYFERDFADDIEERLDRLVDPVASLAVKLLKENESVSASALVEEIRRSYALRRELLDRVETRFREILGVADELGERKDTSPRT